MPRTIDLTDQMNKAFQKLYHNKDRWLVCVGGAGSGKSYWAGQKVVIDCMRAKEKVLVTRKVARTLRNSVWALIQEIIENWDVAHLWSFNKSDLVMMYKPTGAIILFVGLDDREKIKSIHGITRMWHEEPTEQVTEDLTQLDLRLRGPCPTYRQHIPTFNPISHLHWLKARFFDQKVAHCTTHRSTFADNKFIDAEYIAALKALKKLDKTLYQIYALGKWGVLKGLIYDLFPSVPALSEGGDHFYGLDFGYTNPAGLVEISLRDQEPSVKQLLYETNLTTAGIADQMEALGVSKEDPLYCDPAEPDRIQELYDRGFNAIPAKKGPGSVAAGILFCKSLGIKVVTGSIDLIKENQTYKWAEDKEGNLIDGKPVSVFDHLLDAMRYALFTHLFDMIPMKAEQL